MPHLVIFYSGNLDEVTDLSPLCRALADTMLAIRDESDRSVFPKGGTRVLAFPATHFAVSDGGEAARAKGESGELYFVYLNLRMAAGRSDAVKQTIGEALLATARHFFAPLIAQHRIGLTLQIDESNAQVFDAKFGNLHDLFK
jgi:5-carboxymethyl-2-hydroxymuconate isomerase